VNALRTFEYLDRPTISVWLPSPQIRRRAVRLTTPMTELSRETAALNLDSTHELRLHQMVRVQIGAASTAASVTSIESNPMTDETRYEIRFENTTPSFSRAVAEALGEATVTSLTGRAPQAATKPAQDDDNVHTLYAA
jgi:hypothetical protein